MGRPRKDNPEPSARKRILDAFWALLSQMPFEEITVSALIRRANVSPNTLYYHFDGYDEVVQVALDETLDPRIMGLFLNGKPGEESPLPPEVAEGFGRVALFAGDASGKLPAMLRLTLKRVWLNEMGIAPESLDALQGYEIDFIFAGVVSMLAALSRESETLDAEMLRAFFQRPLGSGIMKTLESLSASKP